VIFDMSNMEKYHHMNHGNSAAFQVYCLAENCSCMS